MVRIIGGPLRIGMLGSGFIAHFHLQALIGVRNVEVRAVYSPTPANREALANAQMSLTWVRARRLIRLMPCSTPELWTRSGS